MQRLQRRVPRMAAGVVTVVLTLASVVAFASPAGAAPSWTIVASPNRKGSSYTTMSGDSCPSATFCVAVGRSAGPTINRTLVEQWNGTDWSLVASPNAPRSIYSSLSGVSCPNVTSCVAVGTRSTSNNSSGTLIEQWNGAGWSMMTSPNPGGVRNVLSGVSCPSTNNCFAVGNHNGKVLTESWNGSSWSVMQSADPGGSAVALSGVSCPSTDSCFAVGQWTPPNRAGEAPLIERWDGDGWSVTDSPAAGLFGNTALTGVSCVTTSSCFAVGFAANPEVLSGQASPVTERWDGERWLLVTAPVPQFEYHALLGGVSCASTSSCFAVGSSGFSLDGSGSSNTLVEQWDGTRWSADVSATPSSATGINLAGVSCASAANCFAVGNDVTPNRNVSKPLIERSAVTAPTGRSLNRPIVGMAATRSGRGYWLVASDGGVLSFGDAPFHGSTGAITLNRPIVGMAATPSGGYWLVASDGGVFSFGDAHFYGSAAAMNEPIVGMTPTPSGHGYWLVGSDGSVFNFGKTLFYGSTSATNQPIVGIAARPNGYWLFGPDGSVVGF
jgi:hypothetical protein